MNLFHQEIILKFTKEFLFDTPRNGIPVRRVVFNHLIKIIV
jgi:hypothetical protein